MIDEEVRRRLHDALDAEPTPAYLLSSMMSSIPVEERLARHRPGPSFVWARPWVAALLAIAVVAGLIYIGHGIAPQLVHKAPQRPITPAFVASPAGVAIAPDGSLYFSDYVSAYVFRQLPDGFLVTVAGTRPDASINEGDMGAGGPAADAPLFGPFGLAFDQAGNLYIVDGNANRVRRIDRHGVITTIAGTGQADGGLGGFGGDGGPGTAAKLGFPVGIAIDRAGAVYIGDWGNGKIRRVDPGGLITSLDESTLPMSRTHFRPGYLALDPAGNLYAVSEDAQYLPSGFGCEIVRRTPAGQWSAVAGTDVCGFRGDGGPATGAQISADGGIAFDSAGNLYFADTLNHRIRRVDSSGVITTVAGTGVNGYSGDGGPAVNAELQFPHGLAMAPGDLLYFAEAADTSATPSTPGRIRLLQISDGTIHTAVSSLALIHTSG